MNIPEILAAFEYECDRQEFISNITDAEALVTMALDSLSEEMLHKADDLYRIEDDLNIMTNDIANWECSTQVFEEVA